MWVVPVQYFDFATFNHATKFTGDNICDVKKWFADFERSFELYHDREGTDDYVGITKSLWLSPRGTTIDANKLRHLILNEFENVMSAHDIIRAIGSKKMLYKNIESTQRYVA